MKERQITGAENVIDEGITLLAVDPAMGAVVEFDTSQRHEIGDPDEQEVDVLLIDLIASPGANGGDEPLARLGNIAQPDLSQETNTLRAGLFEGAEERALGGSQNSGSQFVGARITGGLSGSAELVR